MGHSLYSGVFCCPWCVWQRLRAPFWRFYSLHISFSLQETFSPRTLFELIYFFICWQSWSCSINISCCFLLFRLAHGPLCSSKSWRWWRTEGLSVLFKVWYVRQIGCTNAETRLQTSVSNATECSSVSARADVPGSDTFPGWCRSHRFPETGHPRPSGPSGAAGSGRCVHSSFCSPSPYCQRHGW